MRESWPTSPEGRTEGIQSLPSCSWQYRPMNRQKQETTMINDTIIGYLEESTHRTAKAISFDLGLTVPFTVAALLELVAADIVRKYYPFKGDPARYMLVSRKPIETSPLAERPAPMTEERAREIDAVVRKSTAQTARHQRDVVEPLAVAAAATVAFFFCSMMPPAASQLAKQERVIAIADDSPVRHERTPTELHHLGQVKSWGWS